MRRRMMTNTMFEEDSGFIGIYTMTEEITNDITLNSVLAEFIGSGEIWIKKNMGGPGKTNELLSVIFPSQNGITAPYWTRVNVDGTVRTQNATTSDYYMQAHPGDQFYRFKYSEG